MPKVDLDALRAIPDDKQRFFTAREVFAQARIDAGNEIAEIIKENGRGSLVKAANIACYDVGGFHRRLNNGGFVLPPRSLVKLAYNYLNESCNMLYFGSKGITVLSRHESQLLNILVQMDSGSKEDVLGTAVSMLEKDREDGTLAESLSDIEILRRRLAELASDKYVRPADVTGENTVANIKSVIRKVTSDVAIEAPTIKAIMYIALELRTSIDYLIAPDYSQYTDLRFYNKPDNEVVTDTAALKIFSLYLRVSDESKARLAALAYHYAMANGISVGIS